MQGNPAPGQQDVCGGGLIDTGNRLKESVSGRPVHVAVQEVIEAVIARVWGVTYTTLPQCGRRRFLPAVTLDEIKVEQQGNCYTLMSLWWLW